MTLIDKIVHYIFLLLLRPVLKLVYLSSKVEKKSDTILHYIHPGPFDPYIYIYFCFGINIFCIFKLDQTIFDLGRITSLVTTSSQMVTIKVLL